VAFYQYLISGSAYGTRTRAPALRGPCPNRLDERAKRSCQSIAPTRKLKHWGSGSPEEESCNRHQGRKHIRFQADHSEVGRQNRKTDIRANRRAVCQPLKATIPLAVPGLAANLADWHCPVHPSCHLGNGCGLSQPLPETLV
jgi:hypothetical protein